MPVTAYAASSNSDAPPTLEREYSTSKIDQPFVGMKCPPLVLGDERLLSLALMLEAEPTVWAFEGAGANFLEGLVGSERILFGVLPDRDEAARALIRDTRDEMEAQGRNVCLVPESTLRRQPARGNCELVAASVFSPLAPLDRLRVIDWLKSEGGRSSLGVLASQVMGTGDPVAGVLSLVGSCVIRADLDRPIDAETDIELIGPWDVVQAEAPSWT